LRAQSDLDEIWLYIAADRPDAADRLMESFRSRFALFASQPSLGEVRPELGPRIRSFRVGNYAVYYRELSTGNGIEILRILHGARDVNDSTIL
jgi:toxin ParE1/3/4